MSPATRALLRLARRNAAAERWRTVLVVALIALAVAAAVVGAGGHRTNQVPSDLQATAQYGAADLRLDLIGTGGVGYDELPAPLQEIVDERFGGPLEDALDLPGVEDVEDALAEHAPDAEVARVGQSQLRVGETRASLLVADPSTPVLAGRLAGDVDVVPGPGELLASSTLRDALDADVGDEVDVEGLGTVRVVGEVFEPLRRSQPLAVVGPDHAPTPPTEPRWYVGGLDDPAQAAEGLRRDLQVDRTASGPVAGPGGDVQTLLRGDGVMVPIQQPLRGPATTGLVVATLLLVLVGFVAATAFATAARRRVRELGVCVAAAGATPRHLRRLVRTEALVLGLAGAGLGAVLGVVALWAGLPVLEWVADRPLDAPRLAAADVVLPAALGVLAALVAAWLPARTVSRIPPATALAGRVPLRRVPRWVAPAGIVLTLGGAALIVAAARLTLPGAAAGFEPVSGWYAVGGRSELIRTLRPVGVAVGVATLLAGGAALAAPLLQWLGRVAGRLPLHGRLAVRDSARQRTRSAATVAATMAVLVVPVFALAIAATAEAEQQDRRDGMRQDVSVVRGPDYLGTSLPPTRRMIDEARATLPATVASVEVAQLEGPAGGRSVDLRQVPVEPLEPGQPGPPPRHLGQGALLATPELLELLGVPDAEAVVAAADRAVLASPPTFGTERPAGDGPAVLFSSDEDGTVDREVEVELVEAELSLGWAVPDLLVPGPVADRLDLAPVAYGVVLEHDRELTGAERLAAMDAARDAAVPYRVDHPPGAPDSALPLVLAIAGGGAIALALLVAALTAALAATESDRDLRAMAAVGADPRVRPRVRALQAGYHLLVAGVVALPVGLLLAVAVQVAGRMGGAGVVVPWAWLLPLLAIAPVIVAAPFRLLSRPSPVEVSRRRPT